MGPVGGMGTLGRDPAETLIIHTKTLFRSYEEASWPARVGSRYKATEPPATGPDRLAPHQPTVPCEQPIPPTGTKNCHVYCVYASRALGLHVSNIRAPVITWQSTSQPPGQNFPMWTREKNSSHLVGCPTYRAGPPPYEQGLKIHVVVLWVHFTLAVWTTLGHDIL